MNNLLWKKLARDVWIARGRMFMMIFAIAVGMFGVTTILSAYTILNREVNQNYLGTNPASAQLEMNRVDDSLVDMVRQRPGIAGAEAGSTVVARIEKKPDEWIPLLLFVIKDFNKMSINTAKPVSGEWPPREGAILLEKEALPLINAKVGDAHRVQTPNGLTHSVVISGLVHDPGLAPAWQEQTAYGYITPETLNRLGENSTLHILKITVKNNPMNTASIEKTAGDLAIWLESMGHTVDNIRIPPPGKHPHQSQMNSILTLLLIFSFLALVLSAILTSTLIGGLLAQQVRQIGIMKSIGARSAQIASAYIVMIILMCLAAIILGLPSGIFAGNFFAKVVAQLLNLKIYSNAVPGWVYLVLFLSGIVIPFQMTHRPVLKATRMTVQEAINDFGISRDVFGSKKLDAFLGRIRGIDRTLILALRNTFRRRARLLLTLGLLAAAGGMFITSLNVKTSWNDYIDEAAANRHYDIEIRLNGIQPEKKMQELIANLPGVQKVETWNMVPAAINRKDGLDIERTYPDGGHGSFMMRSVPPGSKMVQSPLISGRWLQPGDTDIVVLNHTAQVFYPNVRAGDTIKLNIEGRVTALRVVGITREILTPATAYVPPSAFSKATGQEGMSNAIRVTTKEHNWNNVNTITKQIEHIMEKGGISVKTTISEAMLDGALNGHVYIFIIALIMMAIVMAVVGALGLMSTMGTNVIERTREFGVMRTIGGKSGVIIRNVIFEGIFIGLISWVISIVISLPLSAGIDNLIGTLSFRSPLPLIMAPLSILIWLIIIVSGSIAASAYPARKASKLTVRETLSYI